MFEALLHHFKQIALMKHDGTGLPSAMSPMMTAIICLYIPLMGYTLKGVEQFNSVYIGVILVGLFYYFLSARLFVAMVMLLLIALVLRLLILPVMFINFDTWHNLLTILRMYTVICAVCLVMHHKYFRLFKEKK